VNGFSTWLYRRTKGRLAGRGRGRLPLLLLTVPGRKSGLLYTVPVAYFDHNGEYLVVGTGFNGTNARPQWLLNLAAARAGQIQIRQHGYEVTARLADGAEHKRLWTLITDQAPHFAEWRARLDCTLPIVVLTPRRSSG